MTGGPSLGVIFSPGPLMPGMGGQATFRKSIG